MRPRTIEVGLRRYPGLAETAASWPSLLPPQFYSMESGGKRATGAGHIPRVDAVGLKSQLVWSWP